jgi:hypothetical protein
MTMKPKILILSAYTRIVESDPNGYGACDWANISTRVNRKYAEKNGYDFKCIELQNSREGLWPTWIKISVLREYLEKDYDYVFWIDADCVFISGQPLDVFIGNSICIPKDFPNAKFGRTHTYTNTGAMCFRKDDFSRKVLADLESEVHNWAYGDFKTGGFHEQSLLDELYILPEVISTRRYNKDFYNLVNKSNEDLETPFETEHFRIIPNKHHFNDLDSCIFLFHATGGSASKRDRVLAAEKRINF